MRQDLDRALALFQVHDANHTYLPISCIVQLEFTTTTAIDIADIHDMIKDDGVTGILGKLERKLGNSSSTNRMIMFYSHMLLAPRLDGITQRLKTIHLAALPTVEDSSWNRNKQCCPGTRTKFVADIIDWVTVIKPSGGAGIYLLVDVVGSGKSTVAHTVAQRCSDEGYVVASFFFCRSTTWRDSSTRVVFTLATHLSKSSANYREKMEEALEKEPGLMAASVDRQFEKLVVDPAQQCTVDQPVIIIADALDECNDREFVHVVCRYASQLPSVFHFFLTFRPESDILSCFDDINTSVSRGNLDIHGVTSRNDIGTYIGRRLSAIGTNRRLKDWPSESCLGRFVVKAGGLFIWAATVCDFLEDPRTTHPKEWFDSILGSDSLSSNRSPANRMDELYSTILDTRCDWTDELFLRDYQQVMGTILTVRAPVSMTTLQAVHPDTDLENILNPFHSLLSGWDDPHRPIETLHPSFREFIGRCGMLMGKHTRFKLDEGQANLVLSERCLGFMHQEFSCDIPGMGYSKTWMDADIPKLVDFKLPEHSWYACQFWMEHVMEVGKSEIGDSGLVGQLRGFLSDHLVTWMEVLSSKGRFQGIIPLWVWMQVWMSA